MICDSPALAALDVELAGMFANMTGQPQVNAAALRGEEDQWSAAMRQRCADPACIRSAYVARIAQLKRRSLRAKGPAAFAETQPFPAPPDVAAEARRYVYRSCAGFFADRSRIVGFKPPEDFAMSACVTPMWSLGQAGCAVRPIFLMTTPGSELRTCRIADVLLLPPKARSEAFLSCSVPDESPRHQSFGVGGLRPDKRILF